MQINLIYYHSIRIYDATYFQRVHNFDYRYLHQRCYRQILFEPSLYFQINQCYYYYIYLCDHHYSQNQQCYQYYQLSHMIPSLLLFFGYYFYYPNVLHSYLNLNTNLNRKVLNVFKEIPFMSARKNSSRTINSNANVATSSSTIDGDKLDQIMRQFVNYMIDRMLDDKQHNPLRFEQMRSSIMS